MKKLPTKKVVVFTGAGISAESGLKTFRDADGLWENYPVEQVCSIQGWEQDPKLVLEFYNMRRTDAAKAQPNAAHLAIAELEKLFDVVVVTQNVDDLHERAGSNHVLHLHGELTKARSSTHPDLIKHIGSQSIEFGDLCELGSQLRPHICWFGEVPFYLEQAWMHLQEADYVLAIGSSLTVEPAASLLDAASPSAEKVLITLEVNRLPEGFDLKTGTATALVPNVCRQWLMQANV